MLNSPLPCVPPRSWFESPNISFNATSATGVNSSSRTSLSIIVPRRAFNPPITAPLTYILVFSTGTKKKGKRRTLELDRSDDFHRHDRLKYNRFRLKKSLPTCTNSSQSERQLRRIATLKPAIPPH